MIIFLKIYYFSRNILNKIKGVLREDQYTFLIMSRSLLLRMRKVSDKSCRKNQNTPSILKKILSKIVQFIRQWRKKLWNRTGHRWQY